MFTTLMNSGDYRIDYFHPEKFYTARAVGLYVSGIHEADAFYGKAAKHQLQEGLCFIKQSSDPLCLVAVYIDNLADVESSRPAFQQMMLDVQRGLLHQIVVHCHAELSSHEGFLGLIQQYSCRPNGSRMLCWDGRLTFTITFMVTTAWQHREDDRALKESPLQLLTV